MTRECLTAPRTYYVAAGNSDSNDGLTQATAWGTPQHAVDTICNSLDTQGFGVTLKLSGSLPNFTVNGPLIGQRDDRAFCISGNVSAPSSVPVSGVNANAIQVMGGARLKLEGVMPVAVQASSFMTGGHGLVVYEGSRVTLGVMAWFNCDYSHLDVAGGAQVTAVGRQDLFGATGCFCLCEDGAKVWLNGQTITAVAGQNYTDAFVHTSRLAMVDLSGTLLNSGAPFNGNSYKAESGSLIVWLGMNPLALSYPGYNDGTSIVIP